MFYDSLSLLLYNPRFFSSTNRSGAQSWADRSILLTGCTKLGQWSFSIYRVHPLVPFYFWAVNWVHEAGPISVWESTGCTRLSLSSFLRYRVHEAGPDLLSFKIQGARGWAWSFIFIWETIGCTRLGLCSLSCLQGAQGWAWDAIFPRNKFSILNLIILKIG